MDGLLRVRISIHALLAESDRAVCRLDRHGADFYPRSPCGERRGQLHNRRGLYQFLSTLSLRRATGCRRRFWRRYMHFYPRSPCGERHWPNIIRADATLISIHALLAESVIRQGLQNRQDAPFLSTLSLRRATESKISAWISTIISIHALLAESDLHPMERLALHENFYPRSPCGERRKCCSPPAAAQQFLSTLSLRRATWAAAILPVGLLNFYPRSPCGERRLAAFAQHGAEVISIHALLAESDSKSAQNSGALLRI